MNERKGKANSERNTSKNAYLSFSSASNINTVRLKEKKAVSTLYNTLQLFSFHHTAISAFVSISFREQLFIKSIVHLFLIFEM